MPTNQGSKRQRGAKSTHHAASRPQNTAMFLAANDRKHGIRRMRPVRRKITDKQHRFRSVVPDLYLMQSYHSPAIVIALDALELLEESVDSLVQPSRSSFQFALSRWAFFFAFGGLASWIMSLCLGETVVMSVNSMCQLILRGLVILLMNG